MLETERPSLREQLERSLPGSRPATIERLVETARTRTVHTGQLIYQQGEPVPLTIILSGYGAARRTTVNGKELFSGVASAGVLFGWSGLTSVPSSVELVALTQCEIGQWPGPEVRALAAADSGLALAAIDSMAWSLHQTVERIVGARSGLLERNGRIEYLLGHAVAHRIQRIDDAVAEIVLHLSPQQDAEKPVECEAGKIVFDVLHCAAGTEAGTAHHVIDFADVKKPRNLLWVVGEVGVHHQYLVAGRAFDSAPDRLGKAPICGPENRHDPRITTE